ncbi:MAG TPA: hypothetical protein VFN71_13475 [Methylomirabilota bacterium]|nr:hypothetical protein [Methylomirabilota bacterium]
MNRRLLVLALALLAPACVTPELVELTTRGPKAQELFVARSVVVNNREPNFEEKIAFEDASDGRVARYLREHPEIQQTERYTTFRFWKQVSIGSTRDEVRALIEDPLEQTIDSARMAVLAERHWTTIRDKVKEAWVYLPGWVIYFDDTGVVQMTRRVSARGPLDE